jgi:hypothetical protein
VAEAESRRVIFYTLSWDSLARSSGFERCRSELDQALITSLAKAGFGLDFIRSFLKGTRHQSHYRELLNENPKRAEEWLRRSFEKALAIGNTPAFDQAVQTARAMKRWLMSQQWGGRTGLTDKAVLFAHIQTAEKTGKLRYHLSTRDAAELAELNHRTVSQANHRLIQRELIRLVKQHTASYANTFELIPPADLEEYFQNCTLNPICDGVGILEKCGVFERQGLNKTGLVIWEALLNPSIELKSR